MDYNDYKENERKEYVEEAKSCDFLNAIFCIYFYNTDVKYCASLKLNDISPNEIFNQIDEDEYIYALEKSKNLVQSGLEYGDQALSALHAKNNEKFTFICESFRLNNQCFNEKNLQRALNSGMRWMR